MGQSEMLRIAQIMPVSEVNGPGKRFVIWLQGCSLRCPGCINPGFQSHDKGNMMGCDELFNEILKSQSQHGIIGVTFTGGEPLEQSEALSTLVVMLNKTDLNLMLFTGFEKAELINESQSSIWNSCQIIVSGRFVEHLKQDNLLWRGSSNQRVFMDKLGAITEDELPRTEIWIQEDGTIVMTGFPEDELGDIFGHHSTKTTEKAYVDIRKVTKPLIDKAQKSREPTVNRNGKKKDEEDDDSGKKETDDVEGHDDNGGDDL